MAVRRTDHRCVRATADILRAVASVLVVDWPSRDVPDTLARAGYEVVVKGGPERDTYVRYRVDGDDVTAGPAGPPPARADLVYVHRPIRELPGLVALATELGARAVWYQSGVNETGAKDSKGCWLSAEESALARAQVEDEGLAYLDAPYIADAVRNLG